MTKPFAIALALTAGLALSACTAVGVATTAVGVGVSAASTGVRVGVGTTVRAADLVIPDAKDCGEADADEDTAAEGADGKACGSEE